MKISSTTHFASVLACSAFLSMFPSTATFAAGFQVSETSIRSVGRALAGAGVAAEGAADLFHNPAGLMLGSGKQFELGLHAIVPRAQYVDRGSTLELSMPSTAPLTIPISGATQSNGGKPAWVPNFYYAADLTSKFRYGLGITSPFGLTTQYDANWVGRYHAIKSALRTLEVNPAVAWRVKPGFSLGAGITLLTAEVELSQAQFTGAASADARATVSGDDSAFGFNVGLVVGDEDARIGVGYRSKIDLQLRGDLAIPALGVRTAARAALTLPATATLSGVKKLSEKIDLLGTIRWTDWSQFDELRIEFGNGLPPSSVPQNWSDSNTYSIGLNYRPNAQWTLRCGVARDESPLTDNAFRNARVPDTSRDWLAIGFGYQASATTRVDVSFAHLFTDDASIRQTIHLLAAQPEAATAHLNGVYEDTATNILAVQIHRAFR